MKNKNLDKQAIPTLEKILERVCKNRNFRFFI